MAMEFYFRDMYPDMGVSDTRTETQPEASDQEALQEDATARETVQAKTSYNTSDKRIYLGIAVMALLAVGLGLLHD